MFILTLITALGCGLNAGIFFAFSSFVMRALGKTGPECGVSAMQSINVVVINWHFFAFFFGAGVVSIVVAIMAFARGSDVALVSLGAALYVLGTIGVTVVCNVPRNNALARVSPGGPEAQAVWERYLREWTWWNHVRTCCAIAAAACFAVAAV